VFARRGVDETVVVRRARILGILALMGSRRGKKRMAFVNFNAAINTRRCAVLKMRPAELTRANSVGEPLEVEMYQEKLKLIPVGESGNPAKCL